MMTPRKETVSSKHGQLSAGSGWKRTETRRGREFAVQPVTAASAQKEYRCPGCDGVIPPGTAHLVVWQVDGVLGDAADLAARRHWHDHCWRIG